jgi:hypothetical protein
MAYNIMLRFIGTDEAGEVKYCRIELGHFPDEVEVVRLIREAGYVEARKVEVLRAKR